MRSLCVTLLLIWRVEQTIELPAIWHALTTMSRNRVSKLFGSSWVILSWSYPPDTYTEDALSTTTNVHSLYAYRNMLETDRFRVNGIGIGPAPTSAGTVWHIDRVKKVNDQCCCYTPQPTKLRGGVYWFHFIRPSVCRRTRVHSVSSTLLSGSILWLQILSTNFRMGVARKVFETIPKFEVLLNFCTSWLSTSCPGLLWMSRYIGLLLMCRIVFSLGMKITPIGRRCVGHSISYCTSLNMHIMA